VINTLLYIQKLTSTQRIYLVMGGFYLKNASTSQVGQIIEHLQRMKPERIIPCHCTGEKAVTALHRVFGRSVQPGEAGKILAL